MPWQGPCTEHQPIRQEILLFCEDLGWNVGHGTTENKIILSRKMAKTALTITSGRGRLFMEEWYAVQTKPRKEFVACAALACIGGVKAYLPALHVEPVNPRARKIRPFFPGYLFVSIDLIEVGLSTLQWVPGVARVIGCGSQPVSIPPAVIEEIRRRVQEVQANGVFGEGQFRRGDRVRIMKGPFEGFEGMFDTRIGGRTRARILIEFLGRLTATKLDVRHLEKVSPRRV